MSKLNNWFICMGELSTNGLVWGDISGISGYSNGEIIDYSAGEKCDNDRYLYSEFSGGIGYFSDYGSSSGCNNNSTTIYELDGGIPVDTFSS